MSLTNTPKIVVNGKTIAASNIDTEVQYHPAVSRREAMVKAAESLIIGELLVQRAKELNILAEEVSLDTEQEYRLIDKLIEKEVSMPTASADECRRFYDANKHKFMQAPLIEAKHILLASDPKDLEHRAQTKALADNLLSMLHNDLSNFDELARQYSACSSKEVGGSLGQLSQGQTVAEFQRQVFAASEGLMHTPVETRFGFHIVLIARKVNGNQLLFEQVKDKVKHYLDDKVHRKAISQYLHQLVANADIQGFEFSVEQSPLMQ